MVTEIFLQANDCPFSVQEFASEVVTERPLPCSQHQPNYHTSNRSSKIPRTTLRLWIKLERTHCQKKKTNWLKNKRDHLVTREKIPSTENKLLNYKAVIKPIWSYGIELWGCTSKSNIIIMQRSQSKILRAIAKAPWYIKNHTLYTDFNIPYVSDVIHERINNHHNKLEAHPSPLLEPLLQPINTRRLKRCRPLDL